MPSDFSLRHEIYRLAWCLLYEMSGDSLPEESSKAQSFMPGKTALQDWAVDLRACGESELLDCFYLSSRHIPDRRVLWLEEKFWDAAERKGLVDRGAYLLEVI